MIKQSGFLRVKKKDHPEVECSFCRKKKLIYPYEINRCKNFFCSKICKGYWLRENMKGHIVSKETREKIKKAITGKKNPIGSIKKRASSNPNWKGGRFICSTGYILVHKKDHPYKDKKGYVSEHRLVAEEILGRMLEKKEVIHHIDFDKKNNKPENLCLFENQKEHMKFHTKLAQFGETNPLKRELEKRRILNVAKNKNVN